MVTTQTLRLVSECKIGSLISPQQATKRWEASGVLAMDGHFFVVFDDRTEIARLSAELATSDANELLGMSHTTGGYEGIAYNATKQRFYLLVEARKQASGSFRAVIVEYDHDFRYRKERSVDFPFKSDNKGFEAVAHMRRGETDFLLALCEGNQCKCGAKGRRPGGGRVQLFEKKKKRWAHTATIALPESVPFVDYSGMSINNGSVAIVSQVNSMLWVGRFDRESWSWNDDGQLYAFPRYAEDAILYGNIEGVSWITPTRIVAISDRRKKRTQTDEKLSEKDQSVHIFDIPT